MIGLMQLSGAVVDLIYRVDRLPRSGGETAARRFSACPGGGFNAMVAAARAGLSVAYGGGIGRGALAALVETGLRDAGIPALRQDRAALDQGSCVVFVEPSGERSFVSCAGAENLATADTLAALPTARWTLLSGYALGGPDRAVLATHVAGLSTATRLVFDPAPLVAEIPPAILAPILARADWISANLAEAGVLTGRATDDHAALSAALLAIAPRATGAVLRVGAQGCWLVLRGDQPRHVPAPAVQAIDTNGAGDTHIGAFIAACDAGAGAETAARFANAAAALSTTRDGPASAPKRAEIQALLGQHAASSPASSDANSPASSDASSDASSGASSTEDPPGDPPETFPTTSPAISTA
ncbi:MAG: PfkB family carbohydrate kinase [Pseudomonadota bacterium]